MNLERYIQQSWIPVEAAIVLMAAVIFCAVISCLWHGRIGHRHAEKVGRLRQALPLVPLFAGPALVVIGVMTSLSFFGFPETLVLRSAARPDASVTQTPHCFDASVEQLRSRLSGTVPDCPGPPFADSDTIADAGPVATRAMEIFLRYPPLPAEQLARRNDEEVIQRIRNAILAAIDELAPTSSSSGEPPPKISQRWIVEAIEVGVVEGLSLTRNVRNILVERHVADADIGDIWKDLGDRLVRRSGQPPKLRTVDGSPVSSEAFFTFFGQPWVQQTDTGATIYAVLMKGPRATTASLQLRASDETVLTPTCAMTREAAEVGSCGGEGWQIGTTRLLILDLDQPLPTGQHALQMTAAGSDEVRRVEVRRYDDKREFSVFADRKLSATMACLLPATPVRVPGFVDTRPHPLPSSEAGAEVVLQEISGALWIYPSTVRGDRLADIQASAKTVSYGDDFQGKWLFPYVSRLDGLPPGPGQALETALVPKRSSGPVRPDSDPTLGLAPPAAYWLASYEAVPSLFAYAMDNHVGGNRRISTASPYPIGWRIDVAGGRADGGTAVVWVFSFDPSAQGLVLENDCSVPTSALAGEEPVFDAARFASLWTTLADAMRASASAGTEAIILQPESVDPVPTILRDSDRSRIQMRAAGPGLIAVLVGMLLQAAVMMWYRWRSYQSTAGLPVLNSKARLP